MAKVKSVLYKSKRLANGLYPVMIRVYHEGKLRYIASEHSLKEEAWNAKTCRANKKYERHQELNHFLSRKETEIIGELGRAELHNDDVDFEVIMGKTKKVERSATFLEAMHEALDSVKNTVKLSTFGSYRGALKEFEKYVESGLLFKSFSSELLFHFKKELTDRGVNGNSLGVYVRSIRALYNRAIKLGYVAPSKNPFLDFKVSKLKSVVQKRALRYEEIKRIESLKIEPENKLYNSRQYFMFMYYCYGINFKDLSILKKSNVSNGVLKYLRSKTSVEISPITLLEPAVKILKEFEVLTFDQEYLFPILNSRHNTPEKIKNRQDKMLKEFNVHLKAIGRLAGLEVELTSYVARHTFATVMKRKGITTSQISEMMGHSSEQITKAYLDSFGNDVLYESSKVLL